MNYAGCNNRLFADAFILQVVSHGRVCDVILALLLKINLDSVIKSSFLQHALCRVKKRGQ